MSDAVGWEQLKDLGNAAFKEKQFTTAAEHFSDAIDLDPANHVLYSNRSGAYASMGGKWQEALDDADKCIALKADWAKGYSRKGAAHLGMGQVPKAKEAFEAGLKLDPENAAFKAALAQLASSARSSPAMPSARGFPYTKPPPAPLLTGPSLLINYAIVGSTMAYMLPLFGLRVAFYAYRMAALACFVKFAMQLFGQFGVSPRTLFAERSKVFAHDAAHYTLLSITLMLMRPVPFVLVPMAANAVLLMLPALVEHAKVLPERVRGLVLPRLETAHAEQRQMYIHAFASTVRPRLRWHVICASCYAM